MIAFIASSGLNQLNYFAVPPAIVGGLILLLGFTALFFERRLRVGFSFFLLTIAAAVWMISCAVLFAAVNPDLQVLRLLTRTAHIGLSFIPGLILLFIACVMRTPKWFRVSTALALVVSSVFCIAALFTSGWIAGFRHYFWGTYPQYSPLTQSFFIYFLAAYTTSLWMLLSGYRNAQSDRTRGRLRQLLIAFFISSFAGIDDAAGFGIPIYPFGYIPIFVFILLVADTINRYRLADVTPAFAAENILETMRGCVIALDRDGIIRLVNQSACDLLGYQKTELQGNSIERIFETRDDSGKKGGVPLLSELSLQTDHMIRAHPMIWSSKSGKRIHMSVSASIMTGRRSDDWGEGIVYVGNDLTEREQSQHAINEIEKRFQLVVENVQDYAIVVLDCMGHIDTWNLGAERITGYQANEVLGKHFALFFTPEDQRADKPQFEIEYAAKHNFFMEDEGIRVRKGGARYWSQSTLTALKDQMGELKGFLKITRDITLRKQLQDERDRYFNLAQDMLCIADERGFFSQLNPAWEKVLGWTITELMAKPFVEFIHPQDREMTASEAGKLMQGGQQITVNFENRYLAKDGTYKTFLWNAVKPKGEFKIYASARDITEAKKNRQARLRLAAIVEGSNDAILIISVEGEILSWNRGAEKIYGYSAAEAVGKSISMLFPANRISELRDISLCAAGSDGVENLEIVGLRRDGGQVPMLISILIIKDPIENFNAIAIIGRNMTKVKEAEEVLRHRKDLEMKSNFISMVSHELRTPLTVIKMGVDILRSGEAGNLNEQQREWADMCERNVTRLTRLITRVLDFQKLESGQAKLDFKEADLNELIKEVEKSVRLLLKGKNVELRFDLAKDLPLVPVDHDKMTEVLVNLIDNAVKFTEQGHVCVTTQAETGSIKIEVKDTGIGIETDDIPKLFSSFTQVHGPAHKTGGTGLGLAISKEIITEHGGQIWVESQLKRGTTFHILLPLKRSDDKNQKKG